MNDLSSTTTEVESELLILLSADRDDLLRPIGVIELLA